MNNERLFPQGEENAAREMADMLSGYSRASDLQKLKGIQAIQKTLDEANEQNYTYKMSKEDSAYDFYLDGKLALTLKVLGPNMAAYLAEVLKAAFNQGSEFTARKIFEKIK